MYFNTFSRVKDLLGYEPSEIIGTRILLDLGHIEDIYYKYRCHTSCKSYSLQHTTQSFSFRKLVFMFTARKNVNNFECLIIM